jgi:hypothetical protein
MAQSSVKIYNVGTGTMNSFKMVSTSDSVKDLVGIININPPDNNSVMASFYYPRTDTFLVKSLKSCFSTTCGMEETFTFCSGTYWIDLAPFDTSLTLVAQFEDNGCYAGTTNYLGYGKCGLSGNYYDYYQNPTYSIQKTFFPPTNDSVLYGFTNGGLSKAYFQQCPPKLSDSIGWMLLKEAKAPTYFYIVPVNPNILFFTASDTLWHSNDAGKTWNVSALANIKSVCYSPQNGLFYACSDIATAGEYVSMDSGRTFHRTDTIAAYSIAVDTANGAIYICTPRGLFRSDNAGNSYYPYNNVFTKSPLVSVAANVYGKLLCAANDGLYDIKTSDVITTLVAPVNNANWIPQPVTLHWDDMRAASYHVQVATDSNFTDVILDDTTATKTSKILDSLQMNKKYFWHVRATIPQVTVNEWSQTWSFTTLPLLPTQTDLISPHNDTILYKTRVDFSWDAVLNVPLNYWFEIADNDSLENSYIDSTLTDTTAALYEPLVTQTYWWRVRAQNAAGWGPFSPLYHFTMLGSNDVAEMNAPVKSGLIQNYPNPFTSSTLIRIPAQTQVVSLKIYDALGREVADLSAEARSGNTSIPFDGNRLPAGVYVCRMRGVDFVSSKLMVLDK